MNSIDINTSQNVIINYEVSGVGERIIAQIIDLCIKFGYCMVVLFIVSMLDIGFASATTQVLLLPVYVYGLMFEIFMQGQSPGKRMRQIRVVKLDGGQASIGAYVIRWLFRLIDVDLLAGSVAIIAISVTQKGQRLGDLVAETTVIKADVRVSLMDTLYEKLHSEHQVIYPEANKLNSNDIVLIKKVLNTYEYRTNFEMVYNLSNRIQGKMEVDRKENPIEFLEAVVKDYNFLCDE